MVITKENCIEKMKLEVCSKIPGCGSGCARTKTFRVIDHTRGLEFILYKNATGKFDNCGIVESKIMERVWQIADKVFRRRTEETVSFYMLYSDVTWSFFSQVLEEGGCVKDDWEMNAHHCDRNWYNHRVENGQFLTPSTHKSFHCGAEAAADQGYDAFIAFVKSLNNPDLLAHYANDQGQVLFRNEDDNQMQKDVILEFFGSIKHYDQCCKVLLERTVGQTEKEIRFEITL